MAALPVSCVPLSAQPAVPELERAYFTAAREAKAAEAAMEPKKGTGTPSSGADRPVSSLRNMLGACSEQAREGFFQSLVFVDGKLASARVTDIEGCLGREQFANVLGFFGVAQAQDHEKYWCESRASCAELDGHICTSNCRSDPEPRPRPGDAMLQGGSQFDVGYFSLSRMLDAYAANVRGELLERLDFSGPALRTAFLRALPGETKDVEASCAKFNAPGGRAWCPDSGPASCKPCPPR